MSLDSSQLKRDTTEPHRRRRIDGRAVFPGVDGRTIQAKRFQQLLGGLSAEFEGITEPDKCLIRNAAFLVLKCEDLQARHLQGEPVANDEIIRLSALLNRSMLALKRRSAALASTAPAVADHWLSNQDNDDDGGDA